MVDRLPAVVLQSVLAKTDPIDCARAACVDHRWQQNSSDEEIWRTFCLRDFAVSSTLDPDGSPCKTFKDTYTSWRTCFQQYPIPLVTRTKRCLDQIKEWLKKNFEEVLNSMLDGASFEEIEAAERSLGFRLPTPVRIMYRLCNGQDPAEVDVTNPSGISNHLGLLGGYYFYDHFVNVHWLSLQQVVNLTRSIIPRVHLPQGSHYVVLATSCISLKTFFLDCDDGQVYVGTQKVFMDGEMMPCTPVKEGGVDSGDSMLRWFEWYSHCLQTGMFGVRLDKQIRSISLFPRKAPLCTKAVTRGVQIQSSSVFVPELSTTEEVEGQDDSYLFAYSVRMNLLPIRSGVGGNSMASTQLLSRHWIIKPDGCQQLEVQGKAVIGQYPLLQAGGEEFVYQSCSNQRASTGSIHGGFTFIPGSIMRPTGGGFAAEVAHFRLEVPKYIF